MGGTQRGLWTIGHRVSFKVFSDKAFQYITELLNLIENGAPWPRATTKGRLAFLAKDPDNPHDVLAHRLLSILSVLYRKWGTVRLKNLIPWAADWKVDGFFAGFGGVGAEEAWWETALIIEEHLIDGTPFTIGSADIFKCFDQIQRDIIYAMAARLGMYPHVLDAYARFQEALDMHNTIAGGLGRAFTKLCGIPQGCPLSMLIIAMAMLPWVQMMHEIKVIPRILADDILIATNGHMHLKQFVHAMNLTHLYILDIGGKIAPSKSRILTNDKAANDWLNDYTWKHVKQNIPTTAHMRDLGAHIFVAQWRKDNTLSQRMNLVCQITRTLKKVASWF